ncbi:MAG: Rieske 2Fe-2S domain-containing protein [Planctomycetales bacterium]|nr:Rieske 2Fe-2S domain-containing protein [Planctomycetales bacterium]
MGLNPRSKAPNDETDGTSPLWRAHFSVDLDLEKANSRRQFLGGAAIAGGTIACSKIALSTVTENQHASTENGTAWHLFPPKRLAKTLSDLADGQAILFRYPDADSPCLLIKRSAQEVVAFSQKCTHLACPVVPTTDRDELHCPCHHGSFDMMTGKPLAGPPRKSLARIRIEVAEDGTLTATGVAT